MGLGRTGLPQPVAPVRFESRRSGEATSGRWVRVGSTPVVEIGGRRVVTDNTENIDHSTRAADLGRYEQYQATKYFENLNGLRALSVIAVVWHHTAVAPGNIAFLERGYLGVQLFFAISGFLITTLLLREHRRMSRISYSKFLGRRALRIFPLYYAVLLAYVVLTLLTRRDTAEAHEFFHNVPAFASYTSDWFVNLDNGASVTFYFAWSLATEEQFYLFWPPLLAAVLTWRRGAVAWPLAIASVLIAANLVALHAVHGENFALVVVRSLSLPMLVGVVAALLLDRESTFRAVDRVLGHPFMGTATAGALVVFLVIGASGEIIGITMVALVVACCLPTRLPFGFVLQWRPLARIGTVSYGIYLLHMLAANALRPLLGHDHGVDVFLLSLVLASVAAEFSFRYFESPLLAMKQRRFSTDDARAAVPAPT